MKSARQRALRELLQQHGQMTVRQLADDLTVSEATIRRDLQELRGAPGLERTHGGVTLYNNVEPPVIARRRQNAETKAALAKRAAEEIPDGATIFIGSGSTMACLAECVLDRRELNVVTNAHNVAAELTGAPGVNVAMTGGALRKGEMSLIGPLAERTLREMPFEVAFMSFQGISADGWLSNAFAPEASTDRVVVEVTPRLVVLVEAYKVGRVAPIRIGPTTAVDLLITDADEGDDTLVRLRAAGLRIVHPTDSSSRISPRAPRL